MFLLITAAATIIVLMLLVRLIEPGIAFFPFKGESETPQTFGLAFDAVTV